MKLNGHLTMLATELSGPWPAGTVRTHLRGDRVAKSLSTGHRARG